MRAFFIALALASLIALPALAGVEDEVRQAETAFAKAFADRDVARFRASIAPDATFVVRGKGVVGPDAITKAWGPFLESAAPPFSWKSEQVYADASGTLAMSIGGVFDPKGTRVATFTSVWRKQGNEWKVILDGPSAPVCAGQ